LLPALVEQSLVHCFHNGCSDLSDQPLHVISWRHNDNKNVFSK